MNFVIHVEYAISEKKNSFLFRVFTVVYLLHTDEENFLECRSTVNRQQHDPLQSINVLGLNLGKVNLFLLPKHTLHDHIS